MSTVRTLYPATLDAIDGKSIAYIDKTDSSVTFRNRNGVEVGSISLSNVPVDLTPAVAVVGTLQEPREVIVKDWLARGMPNAVVGVDVAPTSSMTGCVWAPDAKTVVFLRSDYSSTDNYYAYSIHDDGTFTRRTLFAPNSDGNLGPTSTILGMSFSKNGLYLAVVYQAAPYLSTYKLNSSGTYDELGYVGGPGGPPWAVRWSSTGNQLAVSWWKDATHGGSALIYDLDTESFSDPLVLNTELSDPAVQAQYRNFAWSPQGNYLAIQRDNSSTQRLEIWKKQSTGTFAKLAAPVSPPVAGNSRTLEWSPNGRYLSYGIGQAPWVWFYKRSGDVFTKLPNQAPNLAGPVRSATWSPDSRYLVVASTSSPSLNVYRCSGDDFIPVSGSSWNGVLTLSDAKFSPDGKFMTMSSTASSYLQILKTVGAPWKGMLTRLLADDEN